MAQPNDILPIGQNYYCRIIYKEKYDYNPLNIISVSIKEYVYEILPKIELILKYDHTIFEQYPIEDNDIITVYLGKSSDDSNIVKMDFMIHDYKMSVIGDDRALAIQITGILKAKNLFNLQTKSYKNKNSLDVCIDVINDCGLNLTTGSPTLNVSNIYPNDKMTWYQLNQNNFDFLKHVLKRTYVHDDCVMLYGDHSGNIIYTTINKEINKRDSKIAKFNVENFSLWQPTNDEDKNTIWYNSYEIINLQGSFNKETNYGVRAEYYDLTNDTAVNYSNYTRMTELSFIDKTYLGKPVFNMYAGTLHDKNLYGDKYFESLVRNYYIRNNLLGLSIELNVNAMSDINLFDVIDLSLNSKTAEGYNRVLSGKYLVVGIVHYVSMNGIYQKRLLLARNGFNKPVGTNFIPRNA